MSTIVNRFLQRNVMPPLVAVILAGLSVAMVVVQPARANWTGGIGRGYCCAECG